MKLEEKIARLDRHLAGLGMTAVAFSGGVDSTALLHACVRTLGRQSVVAVTADSESLPRHEKKEATNLAKSIGAEHLFLETREIENPDYVKNDSRRCYHCKRELFSSMDFLMKARGWNSLVYGAIVDDFSDFRPGSDAASEYRVIAPFVEAEWSKEDVRAYSRREGLPTHAKPSFACLASRIARGMTVSAEALTMVERAESVLRRLGYAQYRVRHYGTAARIELEPPEIPKLWQRHRSLVWRRLRETGFQEVFLDLKGYRDPGTKLGTISPAWSQFDCSEQGWTRLDGRLAEKAWKIFHESGAPDRSICLSLNPK